MGAHEGTLAAMVGGERAAYERVKPVFGRWATLVVHMGPVGAGTRTKLARNLMHFIAYTGGRRGPAPGRGGRARPAEAGPGGPPLRRGHRRPGAIMVRDTTAPLAPGRRPVRDLQPHPRARREGPHARPLELADGLGVDLPLGPPGPRGARRAETSGSRHPPAP